MKGVNVVVASLTLLSLIISSGSVHAGESSSPQLTVVVTVPALKPVVELVGGERVEVVSLIPPGTDPHHYEPPWIELVETLSKCDLVVMTGPSHLPVEERIRELIAEGLIKAVLIDYEDYATHGLKLLKFPETNTLNPHGYFLHLTGIEIIAEVVVSELKALDPAGREVYEARLKALKSLLDGLREESRELIKLTDVRSVAILTPKLHYVLSDLGVKVSDVLIATHGIEVSAADVTKLIHSYSEGAIDLVVVTDEDIARYPGLIELLENEGVEYVVVPLTEVPDKPYLVQYLLALKIAEVRGESPGISGVGVRGQVDIDQLYVGIILGETLLLVLLAYLLFLHRRKLLELVMGS